MQAHPERGFTLVEIAIVLIIVGLLLGGVLKGQELIVQARIRSVSNDMNGVTAAIYAYQDRYRALPGDERHVAVSGRWPEASGGDGNGVICGAYNGGTVGGGACGGEMESRLIWRHLRLSGLITGAGDEIPINAAGGLIGVQSGAFGLSGHVLCASNLPAKIAAAIDAQQDDGSPRTGSLRGARQNAPNAAADPNPATDAAYQDDGSLIYLICKAL
ncbi:MAG: prepilin-type N-terminal cleavage/methylation domain-containing protein [Zoogloeaceae bacterium]|jgi:prepilin-type N-terminal cleavage/methylation domain-containing protein|nr:prepilin-type N-terminal cleavage/methylation domain-containing protein [Zoogloeaceae bacterium]